jgi:hypothetical protein
VRAGKRRFSQRSRRVSSSAGGTVRVVMDMRAL